MLSRQARGRFLVPRTIATRPGIFPRKSYTPCPQAPSLARHHVVLRQPQLWPYRRPESDLSPLHERGMATAVDDYRIDSNMYNPINSSTMSPFPPSQLASFDPSSLTRIPEPAPPIPPHKMNPQGIPADLHSLLPMFDACIRVKKVQRASHVLKRLNTLHLNLSDEELIILHNRYLRASIDELRLSTDRSSAEDLHRWYEVEIRAKGLPITPETLACMLKASLLSERGYRLERLVMRYMEMAPGQSALRVLSIAEILSDTDLAVITKLFPAYNYIKTIEEYEDVAEPQDDSSTHEAIESQLPEILLDQVKSDESDYIAQTEQRGETLRLLKAELSLFDRLENIDISCLPESERRELQVRIERNAIESAITKWRLVNNQLQKMGKVSALGPTANNPLSRIVSKWFYAMEKLLTKEMALIESSELKASKNLMDKERCIYGSILQQMSPSRLAAITILCVINLGGLQGIDKGLMAASIIHSVSCKVQEDLEAQKREEARKDRKKKHVLEYQGNMKRTNLPWDDEAKNAPAEPEPEPKPEAREKQERWSMQAKIFIGAFLVKTLVEAAKVEVKMIDPKTGRPVSQIQPAFTHMHKPRKGRKVGVLFFNQAVSNLLRSEPLGDYMAKQLPMITEPRPWISFERGGFLHSKTSLVRLKQGDEEQRLYTEAAIKCGNMRQVFKGLDVLGRTAWKVNEPLFKVMMEAWNSGEAIANIPPKKPNVPDPPEPSKEASSHEQYMWTRALKTAENERSSLHSQRCYMNLQLEVARAFRRQTIYFPHNVDYRGRAYPIPTYLNHMGADHSRAILSFAKGKKLGARGLKWLKIHLANVYGLDKSSLSEREEFTNQHRQDIIDSATNPLNGRRWWLDAEDPWQCLAACMELKAALDLADPTEFLSSLPIHQDGTCNGLQHYAALGGDLWGAKQVNLEPGDRPADVYSAVADLVKEGIAKDAAADNAFAKVLEGKITRKVVKQTVMTNVYGVTFVGAKKQVCKQLDDLNPNMGKEYGIHNNVLATYVAKLIFGALATMFKGAHDIQYWLGDIGNRVSRALTPTQLNQLREAYVLGTGDEELVFSKGKFKKTSELKTVEDLAGQFRSTIVWTTPLRMPVVQPYRKCAVKEIRTTFQSVSFPIHGQANAVDRRKQLQGFPPNFIHSLDASHMLLSALKCNDLGLTFAAVHDSFWTHAADIDVMNAVLREAFINIHQDDVVGRLADEFRARHEGSIYLAKIDASSPVGKRIKELRQKIKRPPVEELLLEHKRLQLMKSSDILDRKTAKQIITPGSIYEKASINEPDNEVIEETKPFALGRVSGSDEDADAARQEANEELESDNGGGEQDAEADEEAGAGGEDMTSEAAHMVEDMLSRMHGPVFVNKLHGAKKKPPKPKAYVKIWLPLSIPEIPKKGEFDVKRLRNSQYFFS
ncbi:hypothetical protein CDD81_7199 [Ophiocordyceps australis]|uniref:DNA-directed RNA polymerase n=1 Tax=Ophiocordyceps australis TaxID=1399860 RepID=A0A2C5Y428_9HYPO|nr:hypothetical protein CDD81_7199 [Ophiocordyceps australis]